MNFVLHDMYIVTSCCMLIFLLFFFIASYSSRTVWTGCVSTKLMFLCKAKISFSSVSDWNHLSTRCFDLKWWIWKSSLHILHAASYQTELLTHRDPSFIVVWSLCVRFCAFRMHLHFWFERFEVHVLHYPKSRNTLLWKQLW